MTRKHKSKLRLGVVGAVLVLLLRRMVHRPLQAVMQTGRKIVDGLGNFASRTRFSASTLLSS